MNDLLTRLANCIVGSETSEGTKLMREAAAEIKRLRLELAGYEKWARSVNEAFNVGDGSHRP